MQDKYVMYVLALSDNKQLFSIIKEIAWRENIHNILILHTSTYLKY